MYVKVHVAGCQEDNDNSVEKKYTHNLKKCCKLMDHSLLDCWMSVHFTSKFAEIMFCLVFYISDLAE